MNPNTPKPFEKMTEAERWQWIEDNKDASGEFSAEALAKKWSLVGYAGPDRVISSTLMREQFAGQPDSKFKLSTGLSELDFLVNGVDAGELIVLAGKTKNGKTLFAQTLTRNFKKDGHNSLWFSYEVPVRQFLTQMPPDLEFMLPRVLTKNAIEWISDRIQEAKIKFEIRTVFIDHLHYLVDMVKMRNPALELGAIVRSLKRIAIEKEIAIFLISHVRGVEEGIEVTEEHLRDSKLVAAEADTTWIVSRLIDKDTKKYTNLARLSVRNHRRTGVMAESFRMQKLGKFFEEIEENQNDPDSPDGKRSGSSNIVSPSWFEGKQSG